MVRARRRRSSAKRIANQASDPNITVPTSRCTFSSSSIASLKNMPTSSGIMIQPSRAFCEIRNGTQNPAELRTDPCMSVNKAQRHLIYIVGIPNRANFRQRISRLTQGNALRISMKHANKCPKSRVSNCAAVKRAKRAWAQLPPSMKPRCC